MYMYVYVDIKKLTSKTTNINLYILYYEFIYFEFD